MSVLFTVEDHVACVTIDRPDRMNAMDTATQTRLAEIWDEVEGNADIRCVVLTGSGDRAFSAGADLKDDSGMSGVEYWKDISDTGFRRIALRGTLTKPVIARVNGLALGGGLEMAMGCDIIIAADTARFGLPEAKVGRMPLDGGMVMLPRLIPRNIAVGMMMTGRMASADDMARYGLVNSVVPADQLDAETDRWVADILSAAPLSLKSIKAVVRNTSEMSVHDAYAYESPELIAALNSEDADEGVTAFREKRAPVWRGK
ncbi:enoyl-CoA hydratase/isomerase family protein [Aliiroseovarius sp. YM-037]|uniref:enoyl-CoA hydratase/isomerase family protein n=1 Tax=Aliiroseovarius sp. YM-037 TaxID=3341728 RepID=UPI003A805F49